MLLGENLLATIKIATLLVIFVLAACGTLDKDSLLVNNVDKKG